MSRLWSREKLEGMPVDSLRARWVALERELREARELRLQVARELERRAVPSVPQDQVVSPGLVVADVKIGEPVKKRRWWQ